VSDSSVPLCVDLDGTLTPSDTLHESLLCLVRQSPLCLFSLIPWALRGKAVFKHEVAARVTLDAGVLPIRQDLLEWIKLEHAGGRKIILATAAAQKTAGEVAQQLQVFDDVAASDGRNNLSGENKRTALVARFGEKGFDYVGNARSDSDVWRSSRKAIVVGPPAIVERARRVADVERVFPSTRAGAATWLKAMRLHQWAKNALIFLPALLAHQILAPRALFASILAFFAFGLCASSVYLINDLFDLTSDRHHPRKRKRPFAAGTLSARSGLLAAGTLLTVSAIIAALITWQFCLVLVAYYVVTWSYSLRLKRAALVDVMTLAGLYTVRIVAGAAATAIPLSFWILAFSVFMFLSLAIVKRYTELYESVQAGKHVTHGRGYSAGDLPLLLSLGTASGYCTVVVMALYINSMDSQVLYHHHKTLWLSCPLLLYWISRVWLLTTRGKMHDDPVVFALRDRTSLLVLVLLGASVMVAI
jgi:4-hydroxybenzoate polyprenyltransferase